MAFVSRTSINMPAVSSGFITRPKKKGTFLRVTNTTDRLVMPSAISWGSRYTCFFTAKLSSLPGAARLFIRGDGLNHIMLTVGGINTSHNGTGVSSGTVLLSDGLVHEYAVFFDGEGIHTSRDGVPVAAAAHTTTPRADSYLNYVFNNSVPDRPCDGYFCKFEFYNRAFTPEQVMRHYMGVEDLTSCVVKYDLDEGTGTTANDSSGNGRHGTIENCSWETL